MRIGIPILGPALADRAIRDSPNYRGSTVYGKEWGKAVDGNWGERMQDDLNDAIPYLASQGIADPKRVCMMGWSYGGYAASRAAQRDGSKYRCTISGAGVHDLPAMVAYDKNYLGAYGAKIGLGAAGANLERISPSLHARLFTHSVSMQKDVLVPVSQSAISSSGSRGGKVEGAISSTQSPPQYPQSVAEEDRCGAARVKKFLDKHNRPEANPRGRPASRSSRRVGAPPGCVGGARLRDAAERGQNPSSPFPSAAANCSDSPSGACRHLAAGARA